MADRQQTPHQTVIEESHVLTASLHTSSKQVLPFLSVQTYLAQMLSCQALSLISNILSNIVCNMAKRAIKILFLCSCHTSSILSSTHTHHCKQLMAFMVSNEDTTQILVTQSMQIEFPMHSTGNHISFMPGGEACVHYRITLISIAVKIYNLILLKRIQLEVEKVLRKN